MALKNAFGAWITEEEKERIDRILTAFPSKYSSRSHFVRCAMERLLRREEAVLNGEPFEKENTDKKRDLGNFAPI